MTEKKIMSDPEPNFRRRSWRMHAENILANVPVIGVSLLQGMEASPLLMVAAVGVLAALFRYGDKSERKVIAHDSKNQDLSFFEETVINNLGKKTGSSSVKVISAAAANGIEDNFSDKNALLNVVVNARDVVVIYQDKFKDNLSVEERLACIAHEFGHFACDSLFLKKIRVAFRKSAAIAIPVGVFSTIFPISPVLGAAIGVVAYGYTTYKFRMLDAIFQPHIENRADKVAVSLGADPLALVTALRKLDEISILKAEDAVRQERSKIKKASASINLFVDRQFSHMPKREHARQKWRRFPKEVLRILSGISHPLSEVRLLRLAEIARRQGRGEGEINQALWGEIPKFIPPARALSELPPLKDPGHRDLARRRVRVDQQSRAGWSVK
jgi:Zn-dependent protease with chaperone function